jgi:hypothetical protein
MKITLASSEPHSSEKAFKSALKTTPAKHRYNSKTKKKRTGEAASQEPWTPNNVPYRLP